MKKIFFLMIPSLILSCNNTTESNLNQFSIEKYADNIIANKLIVLKIKTYGDTIKVKNYKRAKNLKKNTDIFYNKIKLNIATDNDVLNYSQFISSYLSQTICRIKNERSMVSVNYFELIEDLKTIDSKKLNNAAYRHSILQKIKIAELKIMDDELNDFLLHFYDINRVQVICKAKNDKVKLGEEYQAEIFFAGDNYLSPFIYLVDNDTIPFSAQNANPTFRTTPTSKGFKKHKGLLIGPKNGSPQSFEFEISYMVE